MRDRIICARGLLDETPEVDIRICMATNSRKIREARKSLKLTQGQLAEALGVSQGTISKWETGEHHPDLKSLMTIGDMLGYESPVSFALDRDEHEYKTSAWGKEVIVKGGIEINKWVESPYWDEEYWFDVKIPTLDYWDNLNICGYVLKDSSADFFLNKNSVIFVAEYELEKLDPRNQDHIVYARRDERGLFEVSLRYLRYTRSNEILVMADIEEGPFADTIRIPRFSKLDVLAERDGYKAFGFLGLVIASFALESPDRLRPKASE